MEDRINENKIYYFFAVGNLDFFNGLPKLELSNKQSLFKVVE